MEGLGGCLSIPDLRGRVPRYRKLKVEALIAGARNEVCRRGIFCPSVQHEYDHLMGHVYLDRMSDLQTLTHLEKCNATGCPRNRKRRKPVEHAAEKKS
jgi:peptide deformylase